MIGCLIISLTHSLLLEILAILIIQEAKYKLVYLINSAFYSLINMTPTHYRTIRSQASEMNITGTLPPLLFMAKT